MFFKKQNQKKHQFCSAHQTKCMLFFFSHGLYLQCGLHLGEVILLSTILLLHVRAGKICWVTSRVNENISSPGSDWNVSLIHRCTWTCMEYYFFFPLIMFVDDCCYASSAGDVPVSAHSEGHSLWNTRPRQSPSAHTLGTDGLRCPVHIFTQISYHLTNCSVSTYTVHNRTSQIVYSFTFIRMSNLTCKGCITAVCYLTTI